MNAFKLISETPLQKNTSKVAPIENQPPRQKSKTAFIIAALGFLFLLIACCAVAAFFLVPRDNGKTDNTVVTPTQSPTPTQNNDSDELKKKVANLEKQLADQKKTPTPAPSPINSPTPNSTGIATARVGPTNDGFLSLRTEPSAKTGAQLVKIPSGAIVQLEDCQKTYTVADSHRGRWCMVSYNDQTGWVFDAWLIY